MKSGRDIAVRCELCDTANEVCQEIEEFVSHGWEVISIVQTLTGKFEVFFEKEYQMGDIK